MEDEVSRNRKRIGEKLAKKRAEKGLSVRGLAELSGYTAQNITKIENARYNVSIDILGKILDSIGCELDIKDKE